ncbi:hypothetical protein PUT24_38925 [Streptomyces sp. SP17KL33]|nr:MULTISPECIES: hypothetical protein [unclassified Streptomyces]MEE1758567.1 hypothetical protein [Streptomyces sp. SP18BB07]MEE1836772.1 hypothetical protein [Streptomyces sp. SP17KL33]
MAKNAHTQSWNTTDIPDQTGRTAVVTGANSGLGLAAVHALAAAPRTASRPSSAPTTWATPLQRNGR